MTQNTEDITPPKDPIAMHASMFFADIFLHEAKQYSALEGFHVLQGLDFGEFGVQPDHFLLRTHAQVLVGTITEGVRWLRPISTENPREGISRDTILQVLCNLRANDRKPDRLLDLIYKLCALMDVFAHPDPEVRTSEHWQEMREALKRSKAAADFAARVWARAEDYIGSMETILSERSITRIALVPSPSLGTWTTSIAVRAPWGDWLSVAPEPYGSTRFQDLGLLESLQAARVSSDNPSGISEWRGPIPRGKRDAVYGYIQTLVDEYSSFTLWCDAEYPRDDD